MTVPRPSDDVAAPYSATLAAIAHLPDARWRWTEADRLRDALRANPFGDDDEVSDETLAAWQGARCAWSEGE